MCIYANYEKNIYEINTLVDFITHNNLHSFKEKDIKYRKNNINGFNVNKTDLWEK